MNDIGKKIRQLREAQNMTQEELAHKVGYKSRVSINKIELSRDVPLKKLSPIADALGVTPSELAGWDEPNDTEQYLNNFNSFEDFANTMHLSELAINVAEQFESLDEEHQRMIIEMISFYKSKKQD